MIQYDILILITPLPGLDIAECLRKKYVWIIRQLTKQSLLNLQERYYSYAISNLQSTIRVFPSFQNNVSNLILIFPGKG